MPIPWWGQALWHGSKTFVGKAADRITDLTRDRQAIFIRNAKCPHHIQPISQPAASADAHRAWLGDLCAAQLGPGKRGARSGESISGSGRWAPRSMSHVADALSPVALVHHRRPTVLCLLSNPSLETLLTAGRTLMVLVRRRV